MNKVNISGYALGDLKDVKVPSKILVSVFNTHKGEKIKLDMLWQNKFAKENNLQRLEVLAAIEDMKRTGLLERLSMGIYRINPKHIESGNISFYI
jgi:hypothetical protein